MKKLFLSLSFVMTALVVSAIPAKQGLWQKLTLADGTELRAQLTGDEHLHFWQAEDGRRYVIGDDGIATIAPMEQMRARALTRRSGNPTTQRLRSPKKVSMGDWTHYTGQKKGIVILMQFTDTKFKTANNQAKYNDVLNKENYVTGSFKGSVADYFKAQSNGQFELSFDVAGPYTAKNSASYYGKNDSQGNDQKPDELIVEAVKAANADFNFKDYDWDGDNVVDQVFVVYAGKGEADGGGSNTIWPHMYWLSATNKSLTLDGVTIDTYACANEVNADSSGSFSGIGCFCHEFSHCLGYPDYYDTSYSGWFGMSKFDIMDAGSYNGNSYQPAGYTAYEKWTAGWLQPIVLGDEDVTVENLVATSDHGDAYIMYNDGNQNEFYMIENRQKTNWDASIPAKGLMITHVDFDKTIWEDNTPNTKVVSSDLATYGYRKTNDHQRCTIFHADNDDDSQYWDNYYGGYTQQTLSTDLYPYSKNDSLTATSKPAATLYNKNKQGTKVMQGALLNIKQNTDKTINFFYRAKADNGGGETPDDPIVNPDDPVVAHGDTLFYESFDKCDGTGANDGKWGTNIASSTSKFATDNEGWEFEAGYAGFQCARFGNGTKVGQVTTPLFTIDGEAVLAFRAAGWNNDGAALGLSITDASDGTAEIIPQQVSMNSFEWADYEATITGTGTMKITFSPVKRFFLDEVLVLRHSPTTAITDRAALLPQQANTVYTLDGRVAGNSLSTLPHGIYIISGRKVVK